MAFQRPFLISLKRGDSSQKWGFNIKGGNDQSEPLAIHTVVEDSLAERSGLREGDEVIQVGRVNVQDLALGQVYELLARCGNKIEMFVVREDLFSPRKGKEPNVVKAVVHNPYNSPLSLYSTENIAETLAQQTEVLTEGHISTEEDEGPESLTFKEKSAVFKLLEEQANQEVGQKPFTRSAPHNVSVSKPRVAPPPPPKPKPPSEEHLYNGYDTQTYQNSQNRVEYQTTQKVVNQYQYQQEQPVQYQQSSVYQVSSQPRSPGYHSPSIDHYQSPGYHSPVNQQAQYPGYQSPTRNYQQQQSTHQNSYQQPPQVNYQQYQTSVKSVNQHSPGYHSPTTQNYQPNYQQAQDREQRYQQQQLEQQRQQIALQQQQQRQQVTQQQQQRQQVTQQQQHQQRHQPTSQQYQTHQKQQVQQQKPLQQEPSHKPAEKQPTSPSVSKVEFKIRPAPPPRGSSVKHETDKMTAIYKQQYEQHLQHQYEQEQMMLNNIDEEDRPRAHLINGNIFEHNSTSGTPITYKAPPAAPPKPNWPPSPTDSMRHVRAVSPSGMNVGSVWPPRRSTATEMPRTGFDPNVVRGQGSGRRCVWPPPSDEMRSGCNTPQSPVMGRKIQWNPSPSPPLSRRNIHSPARRKDIQWPPASPTSNFDKENYPRQSPRLSRKAAFDDYVKEHASINVPQTYRPPPGTQHVEFY